MYLYFLKNFPDGSVAYPYLMMTGLVPGSNQPLFCILILLPIFYPRFGISSQICH